MTSLASPAAARPMPRVGVRRHGPLILLMLLLGLCLAWGRVDAVWRTGAFFDSDDAMRLVQIRDLIGGQPWFDMTSYRLHPPAGVVSHWSRIVDLPMVLLIKGFAFWLPMERAERAARLAFPLLLQACVLAGLARLAILLIGERAAPLAIVLGLLSGIAFGQFQPGRIDHHAPQIVLLVASLGSLVAALDRARARAAAVSAALAALSLAISLENLPFILALVGALVVLWVVRGPAAAPALRAYALGLAVALPVFFVLTVGPARWTLGTPDAFSATQLVAGLSGAAVLAGLSLIEADRGAWRRFALAGAGAAIVAATTFVFAPGGLQEPFAGLDPLVRSLWLANVREVWTLPRTWREAPFVAVTFVLPLTLGVVGVAVACWRTEGLARVRWLFVAIVLAVGVALSIWAVRVLTFAGPIAVLGGVALVAGWHDRLAAAGRRRLAALSLAAVLPFGATTWAIALSFVASEPESRAEMDCLAPAALAPLATLPPGLVLAPIDAGAHILAFTADAVVAAPYHRNNAGNRLSLDTFLAAPEAARAEAVASGARYLVSCDGLNGLRIARAQAPGGLAAALARGDLPSWLRPVPLPSTPLRVFEIL